MLSYKQLNERNKCIFIHNKENIDTKTFILFQKSYVTIDNVITPEEPGQKVRYIIDKETGNNTDILRITLSDKKFACFYNHYYYNKGIFELLQSDEYNKFRFHITYKNIPYKLKLFIELYIDKFYLLDLYDQAKIPKLMALIVSGNDAQWELKDTKKKSILKKKYQIKHCLNEKKRVLDCEKYLKINLYNYQKNNVNWMVNIEKNIDCSMNNFDFIDYSGFSEYYIESIDDSIFFDSDYKLLDLSRSLKYKFEISPKGGVLCDEVGLGKTLSMTSLILENPKDGYQYPIKKKRRKPRRKKKVEDVSISKDCLEAEKKSTTSIKDEVKSSSDILEQLNENEKIDGKVKDVIEMKSLIEHVDKVETKKKVIKSKATLIICPNRLCRQWLEEIKKFLGKYDVKILQLLSITNYKKYSLEEYKNADIILIGFTFLSNQRYLDEEESKLRLESIYWYRIIVDEGHELLIDRELTRQRLRQMKETLYKFDAKYKWVCSGTPLGDPEYGFTGIVKFLAPLYQNTYAMALKSHSTDFIAKYFRYNSKESIKNEVVIPPVKETVKFLKQTRIEKAIYKSVKGNELQMMQLCTHVLISDYSAVLNDELDLEKLQETMIKHFTKKTETLVKRRDNLKIQIDNSDKSYEKRMDKLNNRIISLEDKLEKQKSRIENDKDIVERDYNYEKSSLEREISTFENQESYADSDDDTDYRYEIDQLEDKISDITTQYNNSIDDLDNELDKCQSDFEKNRKELEEEKVEVKVNYEIKNKEYKDKLHEYVLSIQDCKYKLKVFGELCEKYQELDKELCPITKCEIEEPIITLCGHYFDKESIEYSLDTVGKWCPICKTNLKTEDIYPVIKSVKTEEELTSINMYGTKMAYLIGYLNNLVKESPDNRIILFTQWEKMMKLIGNVLTNNNIKFVTIQGNAHVMANNIRRFKVDKEIRIILLSSGSCSSGSNLTEATHIVLLDTINGTKDSAKAIETQAIGRANRIGQNKSVNVHRIIMENTIEHDYYIRNMK